MPASWRANTSLFTSVQYWINVGTTGLESPLSALLLTAPYRNAVNQSHTIVEIKDIHPSARLDNSGICDNVNPGHFVQVRIPDGLKAP